MVSCRRCGLHEPVISHPLELTSRSSTVEDVGIAGRAQFVRSMLGWRRAPSVVQHEIMSDTTLLGGEALRSLRRPSRRCQTPRRFVSTQFSPAAPRGRRLRCLCSTTGCAYVVTVHVCHIAHASAGCFARQPLWS